GVVISSGMVDTDCGLKALAAGARGFVPKMRLMADLGAGWEHALGGRSFVPSASVLPRWRARARPSHCMQIVHSEAVLLESAAEFAAAAFREGDVVVVGMEPSRLSALDARLKARGLDPAQMA